jgi:hypothetical protein
MEGVTRLLHRLLAVVKVDQSLLQHVMLVKWKLQSVLELLSVTLIVQVERHVVLVSNAQIPALLV